MIEIVSLVVVAALWGCTNPFIERGTKDIVKIEAKSKLAKFALEIKYLLTNYEYLIPFGLNQCGSVLYFITLQNTDLSLSVPLSNSLMFIFTALTCWMLGDSLPNKRAVLGMVLVILGVTICCYDKTHQTEMLV